MPEAEVNGVKLYYELHGSGEPLALVHGAWVDATAWRFVVPGLAENFRVLSYDRRGHSQRAARHAGKLRRGRRRPRGPAGGAGPGACARGYELRR